MVQGVFFDLYGTLIDIETDEDDLSTYALLSRYLAYQSVFAVPEELKEAYRRHAAAAIAQSKETYPEMDVCNVFQAMIDEFGTEQLSLSVVADIAVLFRSLTVRRFGLFPGVTEALTTLSGAYKLALVSNAQWVFAEPEIEMVGLDRFFAVKILSSRLGFKKPDRRLFRAATEKSRVAAGKTVYIGDSPERDLAGAKGAGMKCLLFGKEGTTYGNLRPDGCFNDYRELPEILKSL